LPAETAFSEIGLWLVLILVRSIANFIEAFGFQESRNMVPAFLNLGITWSG
jgi:hypothetical protein